MTQSLGTRTACAILDLRKRVEDYARLEPCLSPNASRGLQSFPLPPANSRKAVRRVSRAALGGSGSSSSTQRPKSAGSRHGAQTTTALQGFLATTTKSSCYARRQPWPPQHPTTTHRRTQQRPFGWRERERRAKRFRERKQTTRLKNRLLTLRSRRRGAEGW